MREIDQGQNFKQANRDFETDKFIAELEKAYLTQQREPSDRAKVSFAPSGLGWGAGRCARQWYYAFTGGILRAEELDALSIANMAYGTEAHTRIEQLFETAGILIAKEVKITHKDPPIFGFVDLLIRWNGESVVGEIKTAKQESFIFRKTKMEAPGYHLVQLLIYMKVMGKDKGVFIYENKNNQELLALPVFWTDANVKLIDDIFEWLRNTYKAYEDGTLPNRPFTYRSKACKDCPFYQHCWKDTEGVVDLPALELP